MMSPRRVGLLLLGPVALFGLLLPSAASASDTHPPRRAVAANPAPAGDLAQRLPAALSACGFSQIWTWGGSINLLPLFPCDGVYINCWYWDGSTLWDWVSWTSRYGYGQQGWVNDYYINTNYNTLNLWRQCVFSNQAPVGSARER